MRDLRGQGIEPMAVLSLMARLGSSDPVELRGSVDEIVAGFDLSKFGSAPTKFDAEDLKPLTARVLAAMPMDQVAEHIRAAGVPEALAAQFWTVVHDNIATFADLPGWWQLFSTGAAGLVEPEDREFVTQALGLLPPPPYDAGTWPAWTEAVKQATGRKGKGLFMPLRKAVTGRERGPEMHDVMALMQVKPKG